MDKVRVASLQYFIRPVERFEQFQDQVTGLVETAADYKCQLMVFPEYFTTQLLTLGDVKRPIREQVRHLAAQLPRFIDVMQTLAATHGLYIVAGTIPVVEGEELHNDCYVFGPTGEFGVQGKLHMTRFEKEEWDVKGREKLRIFDTRIGKIAVAICYDVEFPEIARAVAREGVRLLVVPSCTDDRQGFLRVRYCAHARCVENQMYVVHSGTVGSLPSIPAVSLNYGQAAILTPSDFAFARDGILAEGTVNQEMMVIGDLDMGAIVDAHSHGSVQPLFDSRRTSRLVKEPEVFVL